MYGTLSDVLMTDSAFELYQGTLITSNEFQLMPAAAVSQRQSLSGDPRHLFQL